NLITAGSQGKNILMADLADGAWESAEILSPPFDIAPLPSPLSAELRLVTKRVGTNSDTLSVFFDTAYLAVNCQLPPTTATVGGPQAICVNGTTTGLGGNTPMTGNGAWSIVSGGVTGAFNPKASFPNAAFTHSSGTGPVTLRWTISSAPCADSTADVVVTVKQPPTTATVGDKQTICADSASAPLGGNMPASGTGSWSLVSGGKGNFSNVSDPNATFTPTSGSGPFVVRWTISSGPCADSWADVTLTLETDLPVVTAPSDITVTQTLCE
ncbi:MAG TPA: hypothetical protein VGR00_07465, partial [Thermoanaerobaculia bacterium]|nr:hypothetical protein [Thermoanaerobaculia bacterium]